MESPRRVYIYHDTVPEWTMLIWDVLHTERETSGLPPMDGELNQPGFYLHRFRTFLIANTVGTHGRSSKPLWGDQSARLSGVEASRS